jgi:hypothetical protein
MRGEPRSFLGMNFAELEWTAIRLAAHEVRNLEFLRRVSKPAYHAVTYGMPYRTAIAKYLRQVIDEEGCGVVFCALLVREESEK